MLVSYCVVFVKEYVDVIWNKMDGVLQYIFRRMLPSNIWKSNFDVVLNFYTFFRSYFIRAMRLHWNASSLFYSKYVSSTRHLLPALNWHQFFRKSELRLCFTHRKSSRLIYFSQLHYRLVHIRILVARHMHSKLSIISRNLLVKS